MEPCRSVSHSFKITTVLLLFILTALRLALVYYFPSTEIIPDKAFLVVVLAVVFYLWLQELSDFHKLLKINQDLAVAHEQLKEAEIDTIASLIDAEEAKDVYTRGHSERVTKIALAIAAEMNLPDEDRRVISRAGILHDIGKIGISDEVLHKKERLSDEDWRLIKTHPENGINILKSLKFLSEEREIILGHHERYDGKGYPRGLRGEEIPLEAAILAAADAFDAMNSRRSYRDPLDQETITSELINGRGSQHAPEATDALLRLLKKNPRLWEK
ncbi:MAG: HD domain-containing protein [Candidatus Omnitrophota bacterium]|nr:HD domain-containing protein [Candidatus Omnitrophota bacterium]